MSPLLDFVTMSRRSSTHLSYSRSVHPPPTTGAPGGAAADPGVRGVELPDHHHHDRVQLLLVDEIVEQRLVHALGRIPVGAGPLRALEAGFPDGPPPGEKL